MFQCQIALENKHILVIADQIDQEVTHFIDWIVQGNANLTLMAPTHCLSTHLESCIKKGLFGHLDREFTLFHPHNYHIVVLQNQIECSSDIIKKCRISRTLVSILGDPDHSDITMEYLLPQQVCRSQSPSSSVTQVNAIEDWQVQSQAVETRKGKLYLVGVGPGSPEYLTVKAQRLIHSVPVIISDRLVSREIFSSIPPDTRLLFTRKVCGKATEAQKEIENWIVEHLSQGFDVVRVKGGDPFVFGRGGEEWNLACTLGFEVEYVPGVSSCISAPGAAGIPVTHRGVADSFIVCTGQRADGVWSRIPFFDSHRTLVLLMATGVFSSLDKHLIQDCGYPPDLPVAVVHRATYEDQVILRGSLLDIVDRINQHGISNHATIIIGHVVDCLDHSSLTLINSVF
jgi:uroporphyrin-III C-methyltransferase